eukprot:gene23530-biopygen23838
MTCSIRVSGGRTCAGPDRSVEQTILAAPTLGAEHCADCGRGSQPRPPLPCPRPICHIALADHHLARAISVCVRVCARAGARVCARIFSARGVHARNPVLKNVFLRSLKDEMETDWAASKMTVLTKRVTDFSRRSKTRGRVSLRG